jgi:hypothetical protein
VQLWARASAVAPITRDLSISLAVAALPAPPLAAARTTRVLAVGLSARPGRRARDSIEGSRGEELQFEVVRLAAADTTHAESHDTATVAGDDARSHTRIPALNHGTVRIRVRAAHARRVELSGEPFGWKPVELTRVQHGWWQADRPMRPGTYRMSVRVDGRRWTAPPGYPPLRDEFGGEVSLVTVP